MSRHAWRLVLGAVLLSAPLSVDPASAHASTDLPVVVSANPSDVTPNVEADSVVSHTAIFAYAKHRNRMYAGGTFHTVSNASDTATYTRNNIVAFDATTGVIAKWRPDINGEVWAIAAKNNAVFVGGTFSDVNGVARKAIAKINARTGAVIDAFNAHFKTGQVKSLKLVDGRLIVGGSFPGQLRALNPVTGADTGYITAAITGNLSSTSGPTGVYRFAVSPDHTRLVAIGNFTTVDDAARSRVFMLDLRPATASLDPWYYFAFNHTCKAKITVQNLRGVDFSPDGSWFVIVSTGFVPKTIAAIGTDVCDAAARFETDIPQPTRPTWINYTGGDTIHSVAATNTAVYVQGHFRCLDNPQGKSGCTTPGSVARKGIGAIDPTTGKALAWNPGKTRGVGGKVLFVTSDGLWSGSDGGVFDREHHRNIVFCPV